MDEIKKIGKPVRHRRSLRKFKRISDFPLRPNENRQESFSEPFDDDILVTEVDESSEFLPQSSSPADGPSSHLTNEKSMGSSNRSNGTDQDDLPIEFISDVSEPESTIEELSEDSEKTNPRIDSSSLSRSETEKTDVSRRLTSEGASKTPDGVFSEGVAVRRTRVISGSPDTSRISGSSEQDKDERILRRGGDLDGEAAASEITEVLETNLEEIETAKKEDSVRFTGTRRQNGFLGVTEITIETVEAAGDEVETKDETRPDERFDEEKREIGNTAEPISADNAAKDLTATDLDKTIEYELSLEEETLDEIDQDDLIETPRPEAEGTLGISALEEEATESVEITPLESVQASRSTPPPSPPESKTKRISVKPPPSPSANAQQPSSAPQATDRGVSQQTKDESKAPSRPAKGPRPWWETFFSEDYLRSVIPPSPAQVSKQCDFILASLGLERGSTILDVGCGLGLHAVELTVRGYLVVGLDLSLPMVTRAAEEAQYRGLKINFLHADIRQIEFDGAFDAVICMGTTFGFFDDESNRDVLSRLHGALKPGGKLLLDVVNRDFAIRSQPNLIWFQGDECVCMEESEFNYVTSRLYVKRTVMQEDGRQSGSEYSVRLYSLHELNALLYQEGFRVLEVSGQEATRGIFFGMHAPRVLLLAMRTNSRSSLHDSLKWNNRTSKKPESNDGNQ
jgi:SAM-dependent methyltransferase